MCCFLPLCFFFAPNSAEHKEMFTFSNSLLWIDWGFQTIISGILAAQLFRDKMIFFLLIFILSWSIFPLGVGNRALTLRWNWARELCASFCSINGLHRCSCSSPRGGEEEAFPVGPLIFLSPLPSSCLKRGKSYLSGCSFQAWSWPALVLCGEQKHHSL